MSESLSASVDVVNQEPTSEPETAAKKIKEDVEAAPTASVGNKENSAKELSAEETVNKEIINVTLVFKKDKHKIDVDLDSTVGDFRLIVQQLTNVPPTLQKLIYKGPLSTNSEEIVRNCKLSNGCKIMLIGSSLHDVMSVNKPPPKAETSAAGGSGEAVKKEPLSKQKVHSKIIEKGVPEDSLPGIKNTKDNLPFEPLSGMRNSRNQKVRLTFKLELDQLWIGTPERTEKVNMNTIGSIVSEPIGEFPQYHIVGLQLGTTELSRYWIYWVPAQYVDAIKRTIQG